MVKVKIQRAVNPNARIKPPKAKLHNMGYESKVVFSGMIGFLLLRQS